MSSNFDWSQFEPVEDQNQQGNFANNDQMDWSQFEAVQEAPQQKPKEERSMFAKAGRVGAQVALGAAENAAIGYELGVALPIASKGKQTLDQKLRIGEDIEYLYEKNVGKSFDEWDKKDKDLYDYLSEQIKPGGKLKDEVEPTDIGIRSLAEKATGLDLHPEGVLEKAANWVGFIKDPTKAKELLKIGVTPKNLIKAISPSGTDVLRGLGAGTALEMAEDGQFGPIGTMAYVIAGDIAGGGLAGGLKGVGKLVSNPKKALAEVAAKFTPKDKLELQKDIIKGFKDSGIQADLGTLTDSNLVRWTQSRLAQSGLTGKALEEFKNTLTSEIKEEYKALADSIGELKHSTSHEAGEFLKSTVKEIRDSELQSTRKLYSEANKSLKKDSYVVSERLGNAIENLEKELKPGAIKSGEQQTVLNALNKLRYDVFDSSGKIMGASVKDLMNNKIALNDIINYEVQGGAKQLLKGVVAELDRAIISHGKENPTFAKNYINANKKFADHAKTFRNKDIDQVLRGQDPAKLMNKMDNIQGIRSIEKVLNKSAEGKELFENLKRLKLQQTIGDNLIDSTTQQAKLGTFSKLLEKGKNREIFKELLPKDAYKRLEKLQSNSGKLADSYNKFYNASKSGVVATDAALIFKVITDIGQLLYGNPWPLMKSAGAILSANQLSKLLADPEFLKLAEEAILATEKSSPKEIMKIVEKMKPYILPLVKNTNES